MATLINMLTAEYKVYNWKHHWKFCIISALRVGYPRVCNMPKTLENLVENLVDLHCRYILIIFILEM